MIEILTVCPANCTTGGPEALHAFVSGLNKIDGVHARLWYWDIKRYPPMPEQYASYGCEYVTELPEGFNGTLIVPEIWANRVLEYPDCFRAIYWLGLDAYAGWTEPESQGAFLEDDSILHIVQSDYAADLLRRLGVARIVKCTDTVNADFYADYIEPERDDIVLYNPAKATSFMHKLIAACPGITFAPIANMTREQVIDTMRHAKLYVDFGEFPGRERMPREAALCGCCVISSKTGSAAYDGDFRHAFKFDSKESHLWAIRACIRKALSDYDNMRSHWDPLRQQLRNDVTEIPKQLQEVVNAIQHYHSGIQRREPHPQCLGFRKGPDV